MGVNGSCHCGQVRVEIDRAPERVTHCNCSVCKRLGALWAYYHPREVRLEGETSRYVWGDRTIMFHHCPGCGVTMCWTPLRDGLERVGINARVLEHVDVERLPVVEFDGAML